MSLATTASISDGRTIFKVLEGFLEVLECPEPTKLGFVRDHGIRSLHQAD